MAVISVCSMLARDNGDKCAQVTSLVHVPISCTTNLTTSAFSQRHKLASAIMLPYITFVACVASMHVQLAPSRRETVLIYG